MNLLFWDEIHSGADLPDFGETFRTHMRSKRNPQAYTASLCAWNLLAKALYTTGIKKLPEVRFMDSGKPAFSDHFLHFSLSHSGNMSAVILSDSPCGVDIQQIRPEISEKLYHRVLSDTEQHENRDFFEVWTKKEALAKLTGKGLPAKPCAMDISAAASMQMLQEIITDAQGNKYHLTALSENRSPIQKPD